MKRDHRLHGLSSDHHHALVLARTLGDAEERWNSDDGAALGERFDAEIAPHFAVEEELLLPALREVGAAELVNRTMGDHDVLREQLSAARTGHGPSARAFGERLEEHVRFEERELFPACEALLPAEVLDAVLRRAPKKT